jgi:hypothetical protein
MVFQYAQRLFWAFSLAIDANDKLYVSEGNYLSTIIPGRVHTILSGMALTVDSGQW